MSTKPAQAFLPLPQAQFHVLVALTDGERHGYAIMQAVEESSGGVVRMGPATLYGTLKRLVDHGLAEELPRSPTDDDDLSRITLTLDGAMHPIDQVTKQLHKLVNVLKIRDLEPDETVTRELALFKVAVDGVPAHRLVPGLEERGVLRGLRGPFGRGDRDPAPTRGGPAPVPAAEDELGVEHHHHSGQDQEDHRSDDHGEQDRDR